LVSIRRGISVALIEVALGVIVGKIHPGTGAQNLQTTRWTTCLALNGSGVLTFLATAS
jgi:hypothetical protein